MMIGQPKMGDSLATITNNEGQATPGNQGRAVGVRNFLVGTPANDDRFNRNEAANDAGFGEGGNISYVPGTMPVDRKYDTTTAMDVPFKDASEKITVGEYPGTLVGDPVQIRETTGEHPGIMIGDPVEVERKDEIADQERTKQALGKLEKVKASRGGFLKGLRERMGATQEKMEAVAAKVGKALDAYNKLEPKTKLMIGLSSCAAGIALGAGGAPLLASAVGVARLATKLASTKAMYDGLTGMLDKKYAELGDVSETRKKLMKVGALATAALVNFGLTDALNNTGITDKMVGALDKLGGMMSAAAAPLPVDTMGNPVAPADNEGWIVGSGAQEAATAKDPWLEKGPGEGNVYTPGQQRLPVDAGLDANESVIKPERIPSVPVAPSSITPSAISTPSFDQNPAYGFDAASAPPVGSVESLDKNGNLQGWTLPDGSFMKPDGTVSAPGVQAITGDDWKDPVAAGERTVYGQTAITETSPVRDKSDLGVEESFAKPLVEEKLSPAQPQTNTWSTADGKLLSSDGSTVTGGGSSAIEGNALSSNGVTTSQDGTTITPEKSVGAVTETRPESSQAFTSTPTNTVDGGTEKVSQLGTSAPAATEAVQQKINLSPSQAPMSMGEMTQLTQLNTMAQSEKFNTVLMEAARSVNKDANFITFGDKGALAVRESFMTILKNNPMLSVENLLDADTSSMSTKDASSLKEARGILTRMLPAESLGNQDIRKASIIKVLQDTIK